MSQEAAALAARNLELEQQLAELKEKFLKQQEKSQKSKQKKQKKLKKKKKKSKKQDVESTRGTPSKPETHLEAPKVSATIQPTVKLCQHWIQGKCNRGDRCRFKHEGDGKSANRPARGGGEQFRKRKRDWELYALGKTDVIATTAILLKAKEALKLQNGPLSGLVDENQPVTEEALGIPVCSQHGRPCRTRVVVKSNKKNTGRLYHTCSVAQPCGFFKWASDALMRLMAPTAGNLVKKMATGTGTVPELS